MFSCIINEFLNGWWYGEGGPTGPEDDYYVFDEVPDYPVSCDESCRCGRWGGPHGMTGFNGPHPDKCKCGQHYSCRYGVYDDLRKYNINKDKKKGIICPLHTKGANRPINVIYYKDEVWSPVCHCRRENLVGHTGPRISEDNLLTRFSQYISQSFSK